MMSQPAPSHTKTPASNTSLCPWLAHFSTLAVVWQTSKGL